MAERGWRLSLQMTAPGQVKLQLHEVEPRRHLRERVLGRKARVYLEERERRWSG